jgi:hypothetical protein
LLVGDVFNGPGRELLCYRVSLRRSSKRLTRAACGLYGLQAAPLCGHSPRTPPTLFLVRDALRDVQRARRCDLPGLRGLGAATLGFELRSLGLG